MGRVKLRELDDVLCHTLQKANYLLQGLSQLEYLKLPDPADRTWWTFPVLVTNPQIGRNTILAALLAEGIPVGVHFPRLMSEHPILRSVGANSDGPFPIADIFSKHHLVLPIYPALNLDHMELIVAAMKKVLAHVTPDLQTLAEEFLKHQQLSELCSGLFMFMADTQKG